MGMSLLKLHDNSECIVRQFVRLGRSYIVMIRCMLARIEVYGWIVQFSGHPDTKACPPTPSRLFYQFHLGERWGIDVQSRRGILRTVEDRD